MITTLGRHIDTLEVSVFFDFPGSLKTLLDAAKEEAKQDETGLFMFSPTITGLPGGPCYIRAYGRRKYQWIIENGSFYAEISTWKSQPAVKFQFKAATLYEYEPDQYGAIVDRFVRALVGSKLEYTHKVRRCDLAVDFQESGFKLPDMPDVITRARERVVNWNRNTPNAITLGKRENALQVQLYNKSEEILVSGKAWMLEVWRASGVYNESLPVWRAEVRWFREGLRSLDVNTLDELLGSLGDLAMYSVGESNGSWLRIADPASRDLQVQTREPASWWSAVCRALRDGLLSTGRKRKGYDPRPSLDHLVKLVGSMMARIAALQRIGYRSTTPLDPSRFGSWVGWQYQKRLALDGRTWPDKVNEQALGLRGVAWVA